jgi:hypothetical protein
MSYIVFVVSFLFALGLTLRRWWWGDARSSWFPNEAAPFIRFAE